MKLELELKLELEKMFRIQRAQSLGARDSLAVAYLTPSNSLKTYTPQTRKRNSFALYRRLNKRWNPRNQPLAIRGGLSCSITLPRHRFSRPALGRAKKST